MPAKSRNVVKKSLLQKALESARKLPPELSLTFRRKIAQQADTIKQLCKERKHIFQQLANLETEKELLLGLDDPRNRIRWNSRKVVNKGHAVGVLLLSDWHIEEHVRPETVNGFNAYNLKIAAESIHQVFSRTVEVALPRYRHAADIEELCVWLGGDFISGYIHPELMENNLLSPLQACQYAEDQLLAGIELLLRKARLKRITIVTNVGNHGRTTEKTRYATRTANNFEQLLYMHLRNHRDLRTAKQLQWNIGDGEFTYQDILGRHCRFFHGDGIKYFGGVGGISVPLNRAITRWNNSHKADITFLGHFHQFDWSRRIGYVVNGSVIGTTPHSLQFGHEEACQGFAVIDWKRGLTDASPIFARA